MIRVITDNVHPGNKIITDQWRAYEAALTKMPHYYHQTINHSVNFVDPLDRSIHTQGVEGFWSQCKRFSVKDMV
jgi:IS1 family transposase